MKINPDLKKYLEENIFPSYSKNDAAHNMNHINYVIDRSLFFANNIPNINYDMVYTIAAYHDIGHYVDSKNHEKISSEMLLADKGLQSFFTKEEIQTMTEAVYDHRASLEYEPRSIYGKIVSSADRNTSVESIIERTFAYRLKHNPDASLEDIIEESKMHIIDKFGNSGYATKKMYFPDPAFDIFLNEISTLTKDKDEFIKKYCKINHLYPKTEIDYKLPISKSLKKLKKQP